MAVTFTIERAEDPDTTNTTSYQIGSAFTPNANSLLVCVLLYSDAAATFDMSSVAGGSLTWNKVSGLTTAEITDGAAFMKADVFTALVGGSPASTTVTATPSESITGCIGWIGEFAGHNTTTPIKQVKINTGSTDPNISLDSAPDSDSMVVAAVVNHTRNPAAWTPEAGWDERMDTGYNTPTMGACVWTSQSPDQTFTATGTDVGHAALIFEIDAAAAAGMTDEEEQAAAQLTDPFNGAVFDWAPHYYEHLTGQWNAVDAAPAILAPNEVTARETYSSVIPGVALSASNTIFSSATVAQGILADNDLNPDPASGRFRGQGTSNDFFTWFDAFTRSHNRVFLQTSIALSELPTDDFYVESWETQIGPFVNILANGHIAIFSVSNASLAEGTVAVTPESWFRLDTTFERESPASLRVTVKLFLDVTSTTADDTITAVQSGTTIADAQGVSLGNILHSTTAPDGPYAIWFDDTKAATDVMPTPIGVPMVGGERPSLIAAMHTFDRQVHGLFEWDPYPWEALNAGADISNDDEVAVANPPAAPGGPTDAEAQAAAQTFDNLEAWVPGDWGIPSEVDRGGGSKAFGWDKFHPPHDMSPHWAHKLLIDLDARDLVGTYASDALVSTWVDNAGSKQTFTENHSTGNGPRMRLGSDRQWSPLEDLPCVYMDNGNDLYFLGEDWRGLLLNGEATMFAVWRADGETQALDNNGYNIFSNVDNDSWWYKTDAYGSYFGPFRTSRLDSYPDVVGTNAPDYSASFSNGKLMMSIVADATSYQAWMNGESPWGTGNTGYTFSAGNMTWKWGGAVGSGQQRALKGWLAELRIYNWAMTTVERQAVEAELTATWLSGDIGGAVYPDSQQNRDIGALFDWTPFDYANATATSALDVSALTPPAAINYPQAIDVTETSTVALTKRVGKTIAATTTGTVAVTKNIAKSVAASVTGTVALARTVGKAISVGATGTVALTKRVGKTIAASTTGTVALARTIGKAIAVGVTGTVALVTAKTKQVAVAVSATVTAAISRQVAKTVAATVTGTVALSRSVGKAIAVTVTGTVALSRQVGKLVAVTTTGTVAVSRNVGKAIAVAVTGTVALTTQKLKAIAIAVTATVTVALSRRVGKAVSVTVTGTVALVRSVGKLVAIGVTGTVALSRRISKTVAATTTLTAVLSKAKLQLVAATATLTVVLSRRVSKTVAATTTVTAALVRALFETIAVAVTGTVAVAKNVGKTIAAGVTGSVALTTQKLKQAAIAVTTTVSVAVAKRTSKTIAATVTGTVAVAKTIPKAIAATVTGTVALVKNVGKLITPGLSVSMALTRAKTKLQAVAVSMTGTVALSRRISKTVDTATTVSVDLTRRIGKVVAVTATATVALSRRIGKAIAVTVTGTVALVVQKTKQQAVAVTVTGAVAVSRGISKTVAVLVTGTAVLSRNVSKAIAATVSGTVAVGRQAGKLVAVAASLGVQISRRIGKTVAVSAVATAALQATKTIQRAIAVTATLGVAISRNVAKTVAASSTVGVSLVRSAGKLVAVGATVAVQLTKRVGKTVAASATVSATVAATKTFLRSIAVTVTGTVALSKRIGKALPVAVSVGVALVRSVGKSISAATTLAVAVLKQRPVLIAVNAVVGVAVSATKTFLRTIAVTTTLGVAVARRVGKSLSVGASLVVAVSKRVSKRVAAGVVGTVAVLRRIGKTVAVSAPITATVRRSFPQTVAVVASFTAAVARGAAKAVLVAVDVSFDALVEPTLGVGRFFFQTVAVSVPVLVGVGKAVPKLIAVGVSFVVGIFRRLVNLIWPSDEPEPPWPMEEDGTEEWPADQPEPAWTAGSENHYLEWPSDEPEPPWK